MLLSDRLRVHPDLSAGTPVDQAWTDCGIWPWSDLALGKNDAPTPFIYTPPKSREHYFERPPGRTTCILDLAQGIVFIIYRVEPSLVQPPNEALLI